LTAMYEKLKTLLLAAFAGVLAAFGLDDEIN
jgi:hypothetical protein